MNDPNNQLTPEQQKQLEEGLARARNALKGFSVVGVAGAAFRGAFRRMIPRPRVRSGKFLPLVIGLVVVVSSLVTCSAGVNLDGLMAEYGAPVPATREAALQFVERTAAAVQGAAASRRLRITISETEATSALSLGLLFPELMQAMDSIPPAALENANDIEELREVLRRRDAMVRDSLTWQERVAGILDPRLRTGDVQVRFTAAGEVVVAGYVQAWRFRQPGLVVFAPRAERGELELDFVKGRLGRMPAPAWGFDMLGRMVASLILLGDDYAAISEITVTAGRLTFEAAVQP